MTTLKDSLVPSSICIKGGGALSGTNIEIWGTLRGEFLVLWNRCVLAQKCLRHTLIFPAWILTQKHGIHRSELDDLPKKEHVHHASHSEEDTQHKRTKNTLAGIYFPLPLAYFPHHRNTCSFSEAKCTFFYIYTASVTGEEDSSVAPRHWHRIKR